MTDVDTAHLSTQVLWAAFGLSLLFGFIAHRSRFCTMGAIADVVSMGHWERARMWALAVAVATLGFNGMVALGWVEARNAIYAVPRLLWLSALVGGGLFGFGMVLASGCGSRNLVRLGGGNLKSLVVLIVMAVTAFATLKGLTAVLRVATVERLFVDLPTGQDLPSLLAGGGLGSAPQLAATLGATVAVLLGGWALWRPEGRSPAALLGGLGIGAVITGVWWVSGVLGFVPEDPQTLEPVFLATNSHRMEALSMASPLAYALDWLLFFSDRSKTLTLGIVSVAGVPLGAAASALLQRSFRWEGFGHVQDLALHLVGASLMGVGGVVAMGCTVGQGISGLSTLSLGSLLAVAGIVAGGLLGLRYQTWRIERMD